MNSTSTQELKVKGIESSFHKDVWEYFASLRAKAAKATLSFRTRGAKLVQRSSILNVESKLLESIPFVERPICEELLNPNRAIILRGPHKSGKSVFLSHRLLKKNEPWYMRMLFPPYGFYLEGHAGAVSVNAWLKEQVGTATIGSPLSLINDAIVTRASTQPIRTQLYMNFYKWLPTILRPQPTIIVIDQAEVLIQTFGAEFVVELYELVKKASDEPNALRLIFVVNSDKVVESLLALNGGNLFTVVDVPRPTESEVAKQLGQHTASVYKDMNCVLGVAMHYVKNEDEVGAVAATSNSASENENRTKDRKAYQEACESSFMNKFGVNKVVAVEDICAITDWKRKGWQKKEQIHNIRRK